jgi:hypothetical protein
MALRRATATLSNEVLEMRWCLFGLAALFCLSAEAATPRLSDCGAPPTTLSPDEPFALDLCPIGDGDDITGVLKDIGERYGAIYVRAPSKTVTVISTGTVDWSTGSSGKTLTAFHLLENEDSQHRMTIRHVPVDDYLTMWRFVNFLNVVIGGRNLTLSFLGTHPGLATENIPSSYGLLTFNTNDGSRPNLVDIRANFSSTHSWGVFIVGGANGSDGEADWSRIRQVNIAGTYLNSGVYVNGGVHSIWYDPDHTFVYDPFVRAAGWDGVVAKYENGVPIGCRDTIRAMTRQATEGRWELFPPCHRRGDSCVWHADRKHICIEVHREQRRGSFRRKDPRLGSKRPDRNDGFPRRGHGEVCVWRGHEE